MSIDERPTEINDRMTKLNQGHNTPPSQEPSLAPSYANIVGTASFSTNVIQTQPQAERFEKLEYFSSEEERRRKSLQVKVTHPSIS